MEEEPQHFKIAGFTIFSNFECGNLGYVELAGRGISGMFRKHIRFASPNFQRKPDFEFDIWTNRDCEGTDFENGNRTWFCFGVGGGPPGALVQFNMMNLNRQKRLFAQGMNPVYMVIPSQPWWDRVPGKPMFETLVGNFFISFLFRMPQVSDAETYFAFTFPHNYAKLQSILLNLDKKHSNIAQMIKTPNDYKGGIYYHRELMCYSPDGLRVDLLTVTSNNGMDSGMEDPFNVAKFDSKDGIPFEAKSRPRKFPAKPVVFITSRVHPGEVQSSFVFNGFLKFILSDDPRARHLREHFVFKLVPFLNPDGVVRGHFRTDYRGINLNRVYHNPCPVHQPAIYAMKRIFLYHAFKDKAVLRAALAAESPYTFVPPPERVPSGADFLIDETTRDALDLNLKKDKVERDKGGMSEEKATDDVPLSQIQSAARSFIPAAVPKGRPADVETAFENVESHRAALFRLRLMRSLTGTDKKSKVKTGSTEGTVMAGLFDQMPALNSLLKDRVQVQETSQPYRAGGGAGAAQVPSKSSLVPEKVETYENREAQLATSETRMSSAGPDVVTSSMSVPPVTFNGSVKKTRRSIPAYFNSERMWPAKLPEKIDIKNVVKQKVNAFKFGFGFRTFTVSDCRCPGNCTKFCAPSDPASPTQMRAGMDVEDAEVKRQKSGGPLPSDLFIQDSDSCGAPFDSNVYPGERLDLADSRPLAEGENLGNTKQWSSLHPPECTSTRQDSVDRQEGGGGVASSELGGEEDAMADNAAINLFRLPNYFSSENNDGKGSGVFAYVDLHGHASKRGTFFYGNHIDNLDAAVETLLLPKILSINCPYFDFDACNFSKANTQARGYSKAGSGRVFFHKATANARCYTLECNYNSGFYKYNPPPLPGSFPGRMEKEKIRYDPEWTGKVVRYNPVIFREVGQALAISLLDMIGKNPYSRLPQSEFGDVFGVKEWLRDYLTNPLPPVSASQYPEVAHVFGPITPPGQGKPSSDADNEKGGTPALGEIIGPADSLLADFAEQGIDAEYFKR
ncbi:unnamed protein product [Notodromas monacha]|uniref:Peptidase M14 domain-containing protein n=1 Tax=Notodromas monacha TaxID=399045 RepID=A0A7R9GEL9_9CRUS|nr:unnamed protein product [Notodromas monacha]CAG0918412.1 unnamed protein product [Notodromas monacha]